MVKNISSQKVLSLMVAIFLTLTGCSFGNDPNVLKVGASQVPHAEILQQAVPILQKEGIRLEISVFHDYVIPNKAVADGQLDANFFQHESWLSIANKQLGLDLVAVARVHLEPMGAYSRSLRDIKHLRSNSTVALPNSTSELTRALLLLDQYHIITLDNPHGQKLLSNIEENPYHLQFKLVEPAMLPRILSSVDLALINTNYALQVKLNPQKGALIIEDNNSPYVNILVTRKEMVQDPRIKKLAVVLTSPEIRNFILQKYKGAILPVEN